jgi:hypothetical protein
MSSQKSSCPELFVPEVHTLLQLLRTRPFEYLAAAALLGV